MEGELSAARTALTRATVMDTSQDTLVLLHALTELAKVFQAMDERITDLESLTRRRECNS